MLLFNFAANAVDVESVLGPLIAKFRGSTQIADYVDKIASTIKNKRTNTFNIYAPHYQQEAGVTPRPQPPRGQAQKDGPLGAAMGEWLGSLTGEYQEPQKVECMRIFR
jgi:hypothetical protein